MSTTAIDAEKERMLAIGDALAVAAGAAKAVCRQITKIEILEATDTDDDRIMKARGELGTARQRYKEAVRVAELLLDEDVSPGISSRGSMWDDREVRARHE